MADNDRNQEIEVYESVLAGMTNQQLEAVQARVKGLVGEDEAFNLCMSVMIASQQLYALARYSLQRECQKEGITWEDGVEELVIKAAKEHSLQPISRTEVLEKVQRTVLKFLTEEVDMQVQDERAEHMRLEAEARKERMLTKVTTNKFGDLDRDKVVVVHGDLKAVNAVISNCTVGGTTLRLVSTGVRDRATPRNADRSMSFNVGINRWSGLASSPTNLRKVLEIYVKRLVDSKCDAVIVANIPLLATGGVMGRSRVRVAEGAIKTLRRWAEDHGSVIIVGLPRLDEDVTAWNEEVHKTLGEHYTIVGA